MRRQVGCGPVMPARERGKEYSCGGKRGRDQTISSTGSILAELHFPQIVLHPLLKQTDSLCGVEERCEAHIQYWNPLSSF